MQLHEAPRDDPSISFRKTFAGIPHRGRGRVDGSYVYACNRPDRKSTTLTPISQLRKRSRRRRDFERRQPLNRQWGPTNLVSQDQVIDAVKMTDSLTIVEDVLRAHGEGKVLMPAKVTMDLHRVGVAGWNTAMPAHITPLGASGVKWVGGYFHNVERYGLPFVQALILIQHPENGYPVALIEGGYITNLRTGAVAGIIAKHYANRDSRSMAVIGAGVQGRFALDGIKRIVPIEEVRVYDVRPEASATYVREMKAAHSLNVRQCSTAEEAVRGADIVVTATTATQPIVKMEWMGPGVTAISIGSQGQEFDDAAILGADKIVCDSWEQCTHLGELKPLYDAGKITEANIFAEIGETVAGLKPGRQSREEYILVAPIGLGSLDIGIAKVAHDQIVASGRELKTFRFYE